MGRTTISVLAAGLVSVAFADSLVPYAYTVSRRGVEQKAGSLSDGDDTTGLRWHTRWTQPTEIIFELQETHEIDRIEIHAAKKTKWHIIKELIIAVDDGFGGFSDPVTLPGLVSSPPRQKEMRDASCTNHVFSVRDLGRAVRVKMTVVSDAYAEIGEVRMFGKPVARSASCRPQTGDTSVKGLGNFKRIENANWRLEFNPVGGRIASLYSKAIGAELTDLESYGSFVEEAWDRRKSHDFLSNKPYAMTYETLGDGRLLVTAAGNAQGGGIDFLKVVKRFLVSDDSTALRIDYRFENIPEAMALQSYGILIRTMLGVSGRDVTCYFPTEDGIVAKHPGRRGGEYWGHRPARGWMAAATEDGTGVAMTMPFSDVKTFYCQFTRVPALEWRMNPVELEAGDGHDVSTEIIPFKGLKTVSGAGGGLVGSLADGVCTVVSSRAGGVIAEADGKARLLSFARPGDVVSFRTGATVVALKRDGCEACRLEAAPKAGKWSLARECGRQVRNVAEADLTCYTNFPRTVCKAWGRPLSGRRLKVSVLTGPGNQIEVGRLAERFDFEFRTVGIKLPGGYPKERTLGNPIFSDGDNFSLINTSDLERGIKRVLKYDSDVILVGGVPFEVLTKELRTLMLDKVKAGAGLVWIGQDRDVPELAFKLAKKGADRRIPCAADGFLSSVPLPLLGEELVYSIATPSDAKIHASCKDRPYVVETALGRGRVFNIAYRALATTPFMAAGLTPDCLRDFYETRTAPVEHYYSLIAKTLIAAAGREQPLSFGAAKVSAASALFEVMAANAGTTSWEWFVTDSFGRELAKGSRNVAIATGAQEVALDALDIPPTQGPLAFWLVVKASDGTVQNWGAWAFSNEPAATIAGLSLDDRWHCEGENVEYSVTISGDPLGMWLAVALVDSYGRTLAENASPPQKSVKGAFRISNALPARCYTLEAMLFASNGRLVSRRRAELRVRPDKAKYEWNDFEVGTWANAENREYLWPDLAAIYHRIGISTVIANPAQISRDFAMRYNIHPTLLDDAGLTRCTEPKEYVITGDKMKLVRPTCLSSPAFFEKQERSLKGAERTLPRYAMRFVWFGDELSLTAYGGGAIDFCFSEHCLKELRSFVRARYGTLERLNAEWDTDFRDWNSVVPFTRQEVWDSGGRHVAGWSDHLEFMDSRLTNSIAFSVRMMSAADPALRFALSGTQAPSAYGGMDWWKILGVMDAGLTYGYGGQYDIHRSFRPDGGFMPWKWGYAHRGAAAVDGLWLAAFSGARGVMGFQSSSQINNDWTFSRGLRDTLPHIGRLVSGTGMHFVNNLSSCHDVAILYSQASLRAAFIENRREEHDKLEEKVRQLLTNLGCSYDYISYEQLERGVAATRGYKALILADALAMSDGEVAAVEAFAAAGGTVIAEGMPATRKENCRKRGTSPLAGLFKSGRHALFPALDVRYLKAVEYPEKPENAKVVAAERKRFGEALARAGVSVARLGVSDADTGEPIVNACIYARSDHAGNPLSCVFSPNADKTRTARFSFPAAAWTYDLVSGRACGKVKSLSLPLGKGTPYAFAQFPEEVRIERFVANGARLSVEYTAAVDGVVRLTVMRPDGTEAECYAKNLLVKGGKAEHEIPFVLSDPKGTWTVRAVSVFGNDSKTCCVER